MSRPDRHWLSRGPHQRGEPRPLRIRWERRENTLLLWLASGTNERFRLLGGRSQEARWYWVALPPRHHRRVARALGLMTCSRRVDIPVEIQIHE